MRASDESRTTIPPAVRSLEQCVHRWRNFPGWRSATTAARRWEDLPERAREYLLWVEEKVGVPIAVISVGAERKAEVRLEVRVG